MSSKQYSDTTTTSNTTTNSNTTAPSNNLFKVAATLVAIVAVILAFYNPLKNAFLRQLPKTHTAAFSNTTTRAMSTSASPLKIQKRPWNSRGHADHGTFSSSSFQPIASTTNPNPQAGSTPSTPSASPATTTPNTKTSAPCA
jgi:hypothetical protein